MTIEREKVGERHGRKPLIARRGGDRNSPPEGRKPSADAEKLSDAFQNGLLGPMRGLVVLSRSHGVRLLSL